MHQRSSDWNDDFKITVIPIACEIALENRTRAAYELRDTLCPPPGQADIRVVVEEVPQLVRAVGRGQSDHYLKVAVIFRS